MNNSSKIILDLCSGTGAWSNPYRDAGYDVRLITLPEHDVRDYLPPKNVYGVLAAPPCTMFSLARTKAKTPRDLKKGMQIIRACYHIIWMCMEIQQHTAKRTLPIKFWAIENPYNGFLKNFIGKPALIFNPWEFGNPYKKATALWGNFNAPQKIYDKIEQVLSEDQISKAKTNSQLLPKFDQMKSKYISPENFGKLDRQARRAITPPGFAKAFFNANR